MHSHTRRTSSVAVAGAVNTETAQRLLFDPEDRLFRSFEITSGSVGIQFSRLWKDEVGGLVFRAGAVTPWDHNPVYGITHRMGYVFLEITPDDWTTEFRHVANHLRADSAVRTAGTWVLEPGRPVARA